MSLEIRDALYGDILLSSDEALLLDTYEMQRLRRIKQLGNVSLVYPCANHTRFEHSLGTRWLAQKIVRISRLPIEPEDEKILYKAALLHDVAEASYVHVAERLKKIGLPSHEEIVQYVLDGTYKKKVIERAEKNTQLKFVCDVLSDDEKERIGSMIVEHSLGRTSEKLFLRQLVNGDIDADVLDYLRRDSFFLGLPYGNYDDRIFASFKIAKSNGNDCIAFRHGNDTVNSILSILYSRYTLRKAAYLHHAVLIADEMFLRALNRAFFDHVVDEFDIFTLGDEELLLKMRRSKHAQELIDMLLSRKLFKRAYMIGSQAPVRIRDMIEPLERDPTGQMDFIGEIVKGTGIGQDEILLNFPPPIGLKDFDKIMLVSQEGKTTTLRDVLPEDLSLLERNYRTLWRFVVSVNNNDYETRRRLCVFCSDYFNYSSDFVPKKSYDELKRLQDDIGPLLDNLKRKDPSSVKILQTISKKNKPMNRDEIAKELGLKPSTVSHYLTLVEQQVNGSLVKILSSHRIGRQKIWIIDEKVREMLKSWGV